MGKSEIAMCVLIGLPGAGKTTLANEIKSNYLCDPNTHVCVITYDDHLPKHIKFADDGNICQKTSQTESSKGIMFDLEKMPPESSTIDMDLTWKEHRDLILELISNIIEYIKNRMTKLLSLIKGYNVQSLCDCFHGNPLESCRHLIIIDDNMFYRSMRYSCYKIAQIYETSYGQIYMHINVNEALKRNSLRLFDNCVSDTTISKMSHLLQQPNDNLNHWERHSLTMNIINFTKVFKFVEELFLHKVSPPKKSDEGSTMLSQKQTLNSFFHQADVLLRRYISDEIGKMKASKYDKLFLKENAKTMNEKRKEFLFLLKNGNFPHIINLSACNISDDTVKQNLLNEFGLFIRNI